MVQRATSSHLTLFCFLVLFSLFFICFFWFVCSVVSLWLLLLLWWWWWLWFVCLFVCLFVCFVLFCFVLFVCLVFFVCFCLFCLFVFCCCYLLLFFLFFLLLFWLLLFWTVLAPSSQFYFAVLLKTSPVLRLSSHCSKSYFPSVFLFPSYHKLLIVVLLIFLVIRLPFLPLQFIFSASTSSLRCSSFSPALPLWSFFSGFCSSCSCCCCCSCCGCSCCSCCCCRHLSCRVAQEPNRNQEPEPSEPFFPKPNAEPEPPEPFSRNRNRNRNRPFLLNCTEIQKTLFAEEPPEPKTGTA